MEVIDVETLEYYWEIPFIGNNIQHFSPIFPKENAILKWDISFLNNEDYDDYNYYNRGNFKLRLRSAPFGEIEVNYIIRTYIYETGTENMKLRHDNKHKFSFENYGNKSSNSAAIFAQSSKYHPDTNVIRAIRIRIAARIINQPVYQEQDSIISNIDHQKALESSYAQELLRAIQANPDSYDVTVSVGTTEFKAHKAILSAVSPVFHAELTHDMQEKNSGCIKIKDFTTEVVRFMMEFIYKGYIKLDHYREALDLLRISDIYDMPHLRKFCVSYLVEKMNQDNILELMAIAEVANAEDLMDKAIDYFAKHPKPFKADDFTDVIKFKPEKLGLFLEKITIAYSKNKRE